MKMFIAFALLIATVVALPLETERKTSEAIVAQPEGTASAAIDELAKSIDDLSTEGVKALSTKVATFEADAPGAVASVQAAIDALLA